MNKGFKGCYEYAVFDRNGERRSDIFYDQTEAVIAGEEIAENDPFNGPYRVLQRLVMRWEDREEVFQTSENARRTML